MNDSRISSSMLLEGSSPAPVYAASTSSDLLLQDTLITVLSKDGTKFCNISLNMLKEWGLGLLLRPGFIESQNLEIRLPVNSELLKHLLFFFENWGQADIDKNEQEVWDNFAKQIIYGNSKEGLDVIDLNQLIINFSEIYDFGLCYYAGKLINFVECHFVKSMDLISLDSNAIADLRIDLFEQTDPVSIFEWKFLWSLLFQTEVNRGNLQEALDYIRLFRKRYGKEELLSWASKFNNVSQSSACPIICMIGDQKTELKDNDKFEEAFTVLMLILGNSNSQSPNSLFTDQRFFPCVFQVIKMMKTKDHIEAIFTFLVSIFSINKQTVFLDNDHRHLISFSLTNKLLIGRIEVYCMLAFLEIAIATGLKEKIDFCEICKAIEMVHNYLMDSKFINNIFSAKNLTTEFIVQLGDFFKELCKTKDFEQWIEIRNFLAYLQNDLKSWTQLDESAIDRVNNSILPDEIEFADPSKIQDFLRKFKTECPSQNVVLASFIGQIKQRFDEENFQRYFFEFEAQLNIGHPAIKKILDEISKKEFDNAVSSYQKLKNLSSDQLIAVLFADPKVELDNIFDFALTLDETPKENMLRAIYSNLLKRNKINELIYLLSRSSNSYDNILLNVSCSVYLDLIIEKLKLNDQENLEKITQEFLDLLKIFYSKKENNIISVIAGQQILALIDQNTEFSINLVQKISNCSNLYKNVYQFAIFILSGKKGEFSSLNLLVLANYASLLDSQNGLRAIGEMKLASFENLLKLTLENLVSPKQYEHLKKQKSIKCLLSWLLIRCIKEAIFNRVRGIKEAESVYSSEIDSLRKNNLDLSALPYLIFYEVIILNKSPLDLIKQSIQQLDYSKAVSPQARHYIEFFYRLGLCASSLGQDSLMSEILNLIKNTTIPKYHELLFLQSYLSNFKNNFPAAFYAANRQLTGGLCLSICFDSKHINFGKDMQEVLVAVNEIVKATDGQSESQKVSAIPEPFLDFGELQGLAEKVQEALTGVFASQAFKTLENEKRQQLAHLQLQLIEVQNPQGRFKQPGELEEMVRYLQQMLNSLPVVSMTPEEQHRVRTLLEQNFAAQLPPRVEVEESLIDHILNFALRNSYAK